MELHMFYTTDELFAEATKAHKPKAKLMDATPEVR
jgi:hypothetical protein